MKSLDEAKKMVARAEEHLRTNRLEVAYIILFEDRTDMYNYFGRTEVLSDFLDGKNAPINEPFVFIHRTVGQFDVAKVLHLSEFENHMDILEHIDKEYKIKGNLYEDEMKEAIKPYLTIENLYSSIGNGDGTDDLEFAYNGLTIFVRNAEVDFENEDPDYWEKDDNLEKAIEDSHLDYIEIV